VQVYPRPRRQRAERDCSKGQRLTTPGGDPERGKIELSTIREGSGRSSEWGRGHHLGLTQAIPDHPWLLTPHRALLSKARLAELPSCWMRRWEPSHVSRRAMVPWLFPCGCLANPKASHHVAGPNVTQGRGGGSGQGTHS
jgi:hypothetical protein